MTINRTRLLVTGLVLSVALNMFLAGMMGARMLSRAEGTPAPISLGWMLSDLDTATRQNLQPELQAYGEALRPLRGGMFRAQREVNRLMASDPMDRDAVIAAFRELRRANMAYQELSHEQIAAVFSQLTPQQRERALRFMSDRRNPMDGSAGGMRPGMDRFDRNLPRQLPADAESDPGTGP
jgi:Spy/CpxP family protein refolding chaperone